MPDMDPAFREKINAETTENLLLMSLLGEDRSRLTARQELRRRRLLCGYSDDAVAEFLG
jgi:hypothetical protein